MLVRCLFAVPIMFLCTAPPAQVEAVLARQLSRASGWMPPGAAVVRGLTIQNTSSGTAFIGISYQTSLTSSTVSLAAFDYLYSNNTFWPRPDFNSIGLNVEQLSISPDLLNLAVYVLGVGHGMLQRASLTSPWSPSLIPIQNVPSNEYAMQFCKVRGVLSLLTCTPAPNSSVKVYVYDAATVSANSPMTSTPPVGNPSNFLAFATALEDESGDTRGFLACMRQQVGFNEQFLFNGGVDGATPWSVFFNTPPNSFFIAGDQLQGGHVVAINAGFGALPSGPTNVVGTFTFETRASILGGWTDVTAMGPPGDFGVIGIATGFGPPVAVPGFINSFGLDGGGLVAIVARLMARGVSQSPFWVPPTPAGSYPLQSASLDLAGMANVFGNTEIFSLN